jgi:hypothetical protein
MVRLCLSESERAIIGDLASPLIEIEALLEEVNRELQKRDGNDEEFKLAVDYTDASERAVEMARGLRALGETYDRHTWAAILTRLETCITNESAMSEITRAAGERPTAAPAKPSLKKARRVRKARRSRAT